MEAADDGLGDDALEVFQAGVCGEVEKLGHHSQPQLAERFFGRVGAGVVEREDLAVKFSDVADEKAERSGVHEGFSLKEWLLSRSSQTVSRRPGRTP